MRSLEELRESFYGELDNDLGLMVLPTDVGRWINDARSHVRFEAPTTATLTWLAGDVVVPLPADFVTFDSLVGPSGTTLPAYRIWNLTLRFTDLDGAVSDGTATLFYGALPPKVTGSVDSVLPEILDQASVSWALARFYRRLASSRSDYRRYSTIAQGNAADIGQLLSEGDRHHGDFMECVDTWQMPTPSSYFGD